MIKVIRFTASWCSPCRALAPILEEIQKETPDVAFQTIDIDNNRQITEQYGVRSVPTVVIENNGVAVNKLIGVKTKMDYVEAIKSSRFSA